MLQSPLLCSFRIFMSVMRAMCGDGLQFRTRWGAEGTQAPLDGCRGYVMTDDFADYNVLDEQEGASARTVGYMHDTSSLM